MPFQPTYLIDEGCEGFKWFQAEVEHWSSSTLVFLQEKFKTAITDDMLLAGWKKQKIEDFVADQCTAANGTPQIADILALKKGNPADAAYADWVLRSVLSIGDSVFKKAKEIKQKERTRLERRAAQRCKATPDSIQTPLATRAPAPALQVSVAARQIPALSAVADLGRYKIVSHIESPTAQKDCQPATFAGPSGSLTATASPQVSNPRSSAPSPELIPANETAIDSVEDPDLPELPTDTSNALTALVHQNKADEVLLSSEFNDSEYSPLKEKNEKLRLEALVLRRKDGKRMRRENSVLEANIDRMKKSLGYDETWWEL